MNSSHANKMEIRVLTGLSQQLTAGMLHVSRTVIAMNETEGRSLPALALLYHTYLVLEMKKPENQELVAQPSLSETAMATWKKELQRTALRCRHEAEKLRRQMVDYENKEAQRLGRLLLVSCAEKVVEMLADKSKITGYNPIDDKHLKWIEAQRQANSYDQFDEAAKLEQMRLQFRCNMLIKEAEEAEKMLGEV